MDMKLVSGILFFLMDVVTFAVGLVLVSIGIGLISDGGEGGIKLVIQKVGEITGINGQMVIFLAGVGFVLSAVGYARKAYQEAIRYERGLKDTVRHFSPL